MAPSALGVDLDLPTSVPHLTTNMTSFSAPFKPSCHHGMSANPRCQDNRVEQSESRHVTTEGPQN